MKKLINIVIWIICLLAAVIAISAAIFYQPDLPFSYLKEKYTSDQSRFIEVKGLQTHYQIDEKETDETDETDVHENEPPRKDKPYIVLIHGTGASLHTWDSWAEKLKQHFKVVRLDLPAFGLTGPSPERNYSLAFYVNFLDEFTDKLGISNFSIAGNSLGGSIAWSYTVEHQEKVDKLILLNSSGVPNNQVPLVFSLARNSLSGYLLKHVSSKAFIKNNLEQVYFDDSKVSEALIERYWELGLREGNRQAFIDRANLSFKYSQNDTQARLNIIKVPTLILWGKDDQWIPVSDSQFFAEHILNSQTIVYPNVGHLPMEEIPDLSVKDSINFLLTAH